MQLLWYRCHSVRELSFSLHSGGRAGAVEETRRKTRTLLPVSLPTCGRCDARGTAENVAGTTPPVAGAVEEFGGGQQLAPHARGQQRVLVPAQVAGGHHGAGRDGPYSHEHAAPAATCQPTWHAATCPVAALVLGVRDLAGWSVLFATGFRLLLLLLRWQRKRTVVGVKPVSADYRVCGMGGEGRPGMCWVPMLQVAAAGSCASGSSINYHTADSKCWLLAACRWACLQVHATETSCLRTAEPVGPVALGSLCQWR